MITQTSVSYQNKSKQDEVQVTKVKKSPDILIL